MSSSLVRPASTDPSSGGGPGGLIAGVVVSLIVGFVLATVAGFIILWCRRRGLKRPERFQQQIDDDNDVVDGDFIGLGQVIGNTSDVTTDEDAQSKTVSL